MSNTILAALSQKISAEALRLIKNKSAFLGRVNTQYQGEFAKKGGKVGDTINVRVPVQFTPRFGPVANIQDIVQRTIPLTIQPEIGVDCSISDFDLTLKFDDFSDNIIKPAMQTLAAQIDMKIAGLYKSVGNSVGTPGTIPTTQQPAQKLVLDAGAKLTSNGADTGYKDRTMSTGVYSESAFLSALNLGFNNQALIGEQYKAGEMGIALGFDWMSSPNVPVHTFGLHGGTPLVNGAGQGTINAGATDNPVVATTSLLTKGWTASQQVLNAGDPLTIAGEFEVHPLTKQSTGQLRQFVSTTDVTSDASGNATVIVAPGIIAGGAYKNVTARPADNAIITTIGAANTTYEQNIAWHQDAFTFACVDMEIPNGMDMASQSNSGGLSVRFVRGFDIINNRRISRFDVLAGWASLRPEWAVRVQGAQVS